MIVKQNKSVELNLPETTEMSPKAAQLESFVTDVLQRNLATFDTQLQKINAEVEELNQLANTVKNIQKHLSGGFKTQMNIGANIFMQAKVPDPSKILLHLGKNVYVEFELEEALKYIDLKNRILIKEGAVVREESIRTRAKIKLALICLADEQSNTNKR